MTDDACRVVIHNLKQLNQKAYDLKCTIGMRVWAIAERCVAARIKSGRLHNTFVIGFSQAMGWDVSQDGKHIIVRYACTEFMSMSFPVEYLWNEQALVEYEKNPV